MSWNVSDLDKNKTEQSIINEEARLDYCRKKLDKLQKEYEQKRYYYIHVILAEMEDKISDLESSISCGEKFINECKEHLNSFES